jgi:tocopherol cyclase
MKGFNLRKIWKPGVFQGEGKKKEYFEGWYFKIVDKNERNAYAIIPGISISKDPSKSHAFIMFSDARNYKIHYFKYSMADFGFERDNFEITIGRSVFHLHGVHLDLENSENKIKAQLEFNNNFPWPVSLFSPGVMGWYAFIPFMECYHGILSFDHSIKGKININGEIKDFTDGKGFIEKDWGTSMPSSWIWMQTNHFNQERISLFGSIAKIPWLKNYFTGYIFGFLYKNSFLKFTTYNGAKIDKLNVIKDHIEIHVENKHHRLEIYAKREEGVDLPAPKLGEMTAKVNETLSSNIKLKFYKKTKKKNELIFSDTGRNAGLEFVGDIDELLDGI